MPYVVECDEGGSVTVPKALSELKDVAGNVMGYDHESRIYVRGQVVEDEDVSPVTKKQYDDGDPHIRSLLRYVSEGGEAEELRGAAPVPPTLGVVTAEESASPGTVDPAAAAEEAAKEAEAPKAKAPVKDADEKKSTSSEPKKGG